MDYVFKPRYNSRKGRINTSAYPLDRAERIRQGEEMSKRIGATLGKDKTAKEYLDGLNKDEMLEIGIRRGIQVAIRGNPNFFII